MLLNMTQHAHNVASKQQQQAQGAHPPLTMIPASNNSVSNNAAATIPNSNNNNNNNATTYTPGATSLYNQPLSAANIYIPQGVHPPVGAATAAVYPAMIPTSNVYVNNVTANVNLHGWPHTVPAYISGGAPHYIHGEVPTDQNGPILQSMPAIQPVALTTSNAIAVQSSASSSSGLSTRGSRRGRGRGGSSGSRRGDYNAQRNPPSESSPAPGQQPQQQPQNQDQSLGQQPQQTSTQQQQQLEVVQPAYAPHPQYTSPYQYATYPAAYFSPQNHILHPAQAATQPATGQPLYVPIYPGHQLYNYQYIPQMMNPGEYQFVPGDDVQCDERQNPDGMVPQIWHHQSMYPEEYAMNTADMQADEINQNAPSLTSSETPSMLSPNYHIYDPQIHEMQQQMSVMQIYDDQQITQITGMHPGGAIPELQDEISECGVPNAAIQMVSTSAMLAPIHMQGDSHIMHHHMHDPSQQAPPHHLIPAPIVAIETHQQVELAAEHVMVDSYVDSTEIATLQSSDSNTNLSEINQQSCESISQEYQQQVAVDELHQQQQPETIVSHYSSHNVSTSSELPSETSELQQNLPTTEPAVTPISERADAASVHQQPQPHSFVPSTFTHHHHQQHRQQMEQQVDFHQQEQQQCEEEQQDQLEQQQQQQDHQLEHQQLENQQQEHHHQDYQQRDYQQQDYQQQDYQQQDYQQQDYQQQDYQQQDYQQQDYQQQEYQQQDYQQQEQQQQDYEQQEYEQQEHQQQEHQHSELEHYEQQMRRPQRLDAQHQQTRQQDTQHLEHQQHGQQQLPLHQQQKQTHQHHQKYQYNNHQQYSEHESCEQHEKQQQYQSQQHHQYFPKHQRSYYSHQNDQQQPYRKQSYHYTQRNYIPRFHNNNNANNQHQHQSNMSGNSSDNSLQTTKSMSWTKSYQKKSTASVSVTATPAANNKTMSGTYIHGTKSYTNHQHHYQQQHQHHYPHQSQHHYNYQQQQPHTRNHGAMKTPSSPTMNTSGPHFERRQNQGESYYQRPTSTSTASTTAVPQQFQNQDQRQQQTSSQSEYTSYVTKHAHSHQNQNYYLNKKNSAAATTSAEPTPPAAPTMNLAPPQPAGGAATSVSSPNTWASLFNNKSSRAPSSTFTVTPSTQSSATVAQPNTVPSASNGTATSIKKPVAKVAPYEGITPTSPAPPLVTPGSMSYSAASAQNLVPAATASATSVATTAADRPAKPEPALPSKSLDEWSVKFADFLTKHKTDLAPISLRPRGLTNRSNYCYINSILQALLGCAPFYNLIRAIPKQAAALCDVKTPTINAMLSFMGNFSSLPSGVRLNNRLNKAGPKGKDSQGSELQCDSAFEPTEIYRLWNESRDEHVEGRQEDAEEFLGYVLNKLNDEMLEVIKLVAKPGDQNGHDPQSENEDGDAWQMICNNRNKGSVTRQTDFGRTPLSDIFRGELRSRLQREGEISTDVIQPFFTLQLNIEKAASVKEALEILVGRDQLEGVTGSKSKQEVVAWQQMTLEKLPVVLILHLKWFDYRSDGCTKILKTVEFPVELKIDPKILASKKYSQKQRTYRLFAVVYHDGKEASKGHYITDVYHTGYSNWLRFDDSSVKPVGEQNVLHPHMPRVPYLLYYRRYDTLPQAFASTGYQSGSTAAAQAGTRDAK